MIGIFEGGGFQVSGIRCRRSNRQTSSRHLTPETRHQLLNFGVARSANAHLLSLIEVDVFAAFAQNARGADTGADRRAHCSPTTAAKNSADYCADACSRANL